MFIGIAIYNNKNNKFYFSKPLYVDKINENEFYGLLLKDIDYSMILNINEEIILNIVKYNNKDSYYYCNIEGLNNNDTVTLGSYHLVFNDFSPKYDIYEYKREVFKRLLDEKYGIEIEFSVISTNRLIRKDKSNDYILSLPILKGNKIFFEK